MAADRSPGPDRILVVDDDPALLRLASAILEGAGYSVATAATGTDALRKEHESQPALVLLDVVLPDVDQSARSVAGRWALTDARQSHSRG